MEYSPALAIVAGALLSTALLVGEHIALWEYQPTISTTDRYTIGTATLGIGITLTAALLGLWVMAVAFWAIAGIGGGAIYACYWFRARLAEHTESIKLAARLARLARREMNNGTVGEHGDRRN